MTHDDFGRQPNDAETFEYIAEMTSAFIQMLVGRDAEVLSYILSMASLDAQKRAVRALSERDGPGLKRKASKA